MRIAITGASGNVGTALLRRLRADGKHEITAISRRRPAATEPYDAAQWRLIDVSSSAADDRLVEVFRGLDAVVHLAWMIQPSHNRALMRATNQGGTRAVAAAVKAAGVPHLVHMSSVGTYAPAPGQWTNEMWSTAGVATSSYSVDKAACERLLDGLDGVIVTRVRPGLILQPDAASEISRYFLGPLVPVALLRRSLVRFAPLPRAIAIQFVHADDVADALVRIVAARTGGAFNLAADPVIDREHFRRIFGSVGPPVPAKALRILADLTWRSHLQPTDAGWLDLGLNVPLMETTRAESELGWHPANVAAHHAVPQRITPVAGTCGLSFDSPSDQKMRQAAHVQPLRETLPVALAAENHVIFLKFLNSFLVCGRSQFLIIGWSPCPRITLYQRGVCRLPVSFSQDE